jgi:hypothetical protein
MQQGEYICLSQAACLLGVSEYYFKEHPSHREPMLAEMREEVASHCADLYNELEEENGEECMNENILAYVALGVVDKLVKDENSTHR